jgi:hypothetical protein
MQKSQMWNQQERMLAGSFDRSPHQLKTWMAEDIYCLLRVDAADAMLLQQLF